MGWHDDLAPAVVDLIGETGMVRVSSLEETQATMDHVSGPWKASHPL
jgi:hypothetical protein